MFNKKVLKVTAQQKRIRLDPLIPIDSLLTIKRNEISVNSEKYYFNDKEFKEFLAILGIKDFD